MKTLSNDADVPEAEVGWRCEVDPTEAWCPPLCGWASEGWWWPRWIGTGAGVDLQAAGRAHERGDA